MAQFKVQCSVTNGSATVIATGDVRAYVSKSSIFMVDGREPVYTVASNPTLNAGNTEITLATTYGEATDSVTGIFTVDILPGSKIPLLSVGDVNAAQIFSEGMTRIEDAYINQSPTYSTDAADAATAAAASAAAAVISKTAALASLSTAKTAANAASQYAFDLTYALDKVNAALAKANTYKTAAQGYETAASAAKASATADAPIVQATADLARDFANANSGVEVVTGEYSAKHHALLAAAGVSGRLVYRGAWSAANGTYPVPLATGDFYRIAVAGTVSGVQLSVGDCILYNGTSWDKIDNTDATTSYTEVPGLVAALNAKAAAVHAHSYADLTGKPTDLAGFGITDGFKTTNPTLTGRPRITGTDPKFILDETDQAGAAGIFAWGVRNGAFSVLRNTAIGRDLSTSTTPMSVDASESFLFGSTPEVNGQQVYHAGTIPLDSKVATKDFEPFGILERVKEVDGAGSGLDIDRLEGGDISTYAPLDREINFLIGLSADNYRVWHAGNLDPVRTVEKYGPDNTGNVEVRPVSGGGDFCYMILEIKGPVPEGWLKFSGQTLNSADYPILAAAYGTPGNPTFTMPNRPGYAVKACLVFDWSPKWNMGSFCGWILTDTSYSFNDGTYFYTATPRNPRVFVDRVLWQSYNSNANTYTNYPMWYSAYSGDPTSWRWSSLTTPGELTPANFKNLLGNTDNTVLGSIGSSGSMVWNGTNFIFAAVRFVLDGTSYPWKPSKLIDIYSSSDGQAWTLLSTVDATSKITSAPWANHLTLHYSSNSNKYFLLEGSGHVWTAVDSAGIPGTFAWQDGGTNQFAFLKPGDAPYVTEVRETSYGTFFSGGLAGYSWETATKFALWGHSHSSGTLTRIFPGVNYGSCRLFVANDVLLINFAPNAEAGTCDIKFTTNGTTWTSIGAAVYTLISGSAWSYGGDPPLYVHSFAWDGVNYWMQVSQNNNGGIQPFAIIKSADLATWTIVVGSNTYPWDFVSSTVPLNEFTKFSGFPYKRLCLGADGAGKVIIGDNRYTFAISQDHGATWGILSQTNYQTNVLLPLGLDARTLEISPIASWPEVVFIGDLTLHELAGQATTTLDPIAGWQYHYPYAAAVHHLCGPENLVGGTGPGSGALAYSTYPVASPMPLTGSRSFGSSGWSAYIPYQTYSQNAIEWEINFLLNGTMYIRQTSRHTDLANPSTTIELARSIVATSTWIGGPVDSVDQFTIRYAQYKYRENADGVDLVVDDQSAADPSTWTWQTQNLYDTTGQHYSNGDDVYPGVTNIVAMVRQNPDSPGYYTTFVVEKVYRVQIIKARSWQDQQVVASGDFTFVSTFSA